jgi:hypothetical protein
LAAVAGLDAVLEWMLPMPMQNEALLRPSKEDSLFRVQPCLKIDARRGAIVGSFRGSPRAEMEAALTLFGSFAHTPRSIPLKRSLAQHSSATSHVQRRRFSLRSTAASDDLDDSGEHAKATALAEIAPPGAVTVIDTDQPFIASGNGFWRERFASVSLAAFDARVPCTIYPERPLRALLVGHNP